MSDGSVRGSDETGGPGHDGLGQTGESRPIHRAGSSAGPVDALQPLPQWGMVTADPGQSQATDQKPAINDIPDHGPSENSLKDPAPLPPDGAGRDAAGGGGGGGGGGKKRLLPLVIGGLVLLALGAAGYAALTERSENGDTASGQTAEPDSSAATAVNEIRLLLQGIGYDGVEVDERDGTIQISGAVESQADVAAVVTASASLAAGNPINTDGLRVEPAALDVATDEQADESSADSATVQADPLQRLQVVLNRTVAATPIVFRPGTSGISSWHADTLIRVADILLANPGIAVAVIGYTDDSGPAEDNQTLSLERADSVRNFLVEKGVEPGLIRTDARGESEATGLRDVGYLERRVEFEVVAASAEPPVVRPLSVGIILPSARNDLAFSQSLVDALDVLNEERGGLTVTITDNMFDPEQGRAQAAQYAADGAEVVILHGAQFLPLIDDLALEFPDVVFLTGPGGYETDLPNVFVYVVFAEQGAYVLGDLAASLSSSGTVSIVGPIEVPEPQRYVDGFRAGAEAQGAQVLSDYVGSFDDVAAATATAEQHVQDGADVLTGTAQLIVGPIDVAKQEGLPWFANQTNPSELAPDNVVAAQVYHFEVAIREILAEIDARSTSGGMFPMTLGNGGMLLEFNPEFPLDPALRRRADDLLFNITAGSRNVEVDVD